MSDVVPAHIPSPEPVLVWKNLVCGAASGPSSGTWFGSASTQEPLHLPFSGEIARPGLCAVRGPNGCGKSTLLKTFLGLMTPKSGRVSLLTASRGYVPQSNTVNRYFHISVRDFIRQGFGPDAQGSQNEDARVDALIDEWQLTEAATRSFHELSIGQKTRAMVARAIVSVPRILFLDEPLASLDGCCQRQLMTTLSALCQTTGMSVLMVDHHFERFEHLIQREIVFERTHNRETCVISFQERPT